MSLHDNLVTLMVATGQLIARGAVCRDVQSLIAPSIRIEHARRKCRARRGE